MSPLDDTDLHSFLVRIRRESRDSGALPLAWRGMIEHLPSGERRYFVTLDQAVSFILHYLEAWGVSRPSTGRLRRWFLLRFSRRRRPQPTVRPTGGDHELL